MEEVSDGLVVCPEGMREKEKGGNERDFSSCPGCEKVQIELEEDSEYGDSEEEDFEEELVALLQAWSLPTTLPSQNDGQYSWEKISTALGRDKKNKDGQWCFVLPRKIGRVETVFGPPENMVERAFHSLQPQEVVS